MINVCYYTEIPESSDWDRLDPALKLSERFLSLSASYYRCAERAGMFEQLGCILRSERARQPEELQWASLHLSA